LQQGSFLRAGLRSLDVKLPTWADTALGLFFLVVGGLLSLAWAVLLIYAIVGEAWEAVGDLVWGTCWVPFMPLIGWRMLRQSS
jgi:hypothetical protein